MRNVLIMGAAALVTMGLVATAEAAKQRAPSKPPSEASIECSKQATEKGLKGQPRRTFRAKCMREYKKAS